MSSENHRKIVRHVFDPFNPGHPQNGGRGVYCTSYISLTELN